MKRFHLLATSAIGLSLVTAMAPAAAQTTSFKDVDVKVAFTSICRLKAGPAGNVQVDFGSYQAFAATTTAAAVTNVSFECSRSAAGPTWSWDTPNSEVNTTTAGVYSSTGSIAGLRYALTATPGTLVAGVAPVLTAGSETNGTADEWPIAITGQLFPGPGAVVNPNPSTLTIVRRLTITF
jgi:hypothetical protein